MQNAPAVEVPEEVAVVIWPVCKRRHKLTVMHKRIMGAWICWPTKTLAVQRLHHKPAVEVPEDVDVVLLWPIFKRWEDGNSVRRQENNWWLPTYHGSPVKQALFRFLCVQGDCQSMQSSLQRKLPLTLLRPCASLSVDFDAVGWLLSAAASLNTLTEPLFESSVLMPPTILSNRENWFNSRIKSSVVFVFLPTCAAMSSLTDIMNYLL